MQFATDNNLQLGIAQLLDNLRRSGITGLSVGQSEEVNQWYAQHASSMTFAPGFASDVIEQELQSMVEPSVSLTSKPVVVEKASIDRPRDVQQPKALFEASKSTIGVWETQSIGIAERTARFASESNAVAACTKCQSLVCSRTRTVYGDGNVSARLVFVGEGPGADEDNQGIPFVGAAGQLLNKIITAMNLKREDVYIMNAVKCRPQNNRTPTDDEVANCQPYFLTQLETIQPEFIVCLGAVASRAVLKTSEGIGRLRGRFHSFRGAKVAVTYHPAYLLRTPDAKKLTWDDMKMVMAAMQ
jgi:uracil-DNA glycosylase